MRVPADTRAVGMFRGYRVFVVPETVRVKKSWRERWLGLPWRPWEDHRVEQSAAAQALGNSVIVSEALGAMYMRESTAKALQGHIEKWPPGPHRLAV